MDISENFCMRELNTHHLPLQVGEITNLVMLVQMVLQPLRDALGRAITVTSGYRSPEVNAAVGGVADSQHLTGQAVDFCFDTFPGEASIAEIILEVIAREGIVYDQLILYRSFIHITYAVGRNRRMVIDKRVNG